MCVNNIFIKFKILDILMILSKKSIATHSILSTNLVMTRKIFCLLSYFTFSSLVFGFAERDFRSMNGQVIRGTIIEIF